MVTIKASTRNVLDLVLSIMSIENNQWYNTPKEYMCFDFRTPVYDEKTHCLDHFEHGEEFVDRDYKTNEVTGYAHELDMFPIEKLIQWDEDNFIKYPFIKVNSVLFRPSSFITKWGERECPCWETVVDSDNDELIEEIFLMLGGLANGGHMCGGYIRLNDKDMRDGGWVEDFGLDGDGNDRIYAVNNKLLSF